MVWQRLRPLLRLAPCNTPAFASLQHPKIRVVFRFSAKYQIHPTLRTEKLFYHEILIGFDPQAFFLAASHTCAREHSQVEELSVFLATVPMIQKRLTPAIKSGKKEGLYARRVLDFARIKSKLIVILTSMNANVNLRFKNLIVIVSKRSQGQRWSVGVWRDLYGTQSLSRLLSSCKEKRPPNIVQYSSKGPPAWVRSAHWRLGCVQEPSSVRS